MIYLLFDIGGTKMRMSYSFDGENLHDAQIVRTPQEFEKSVDIIKDFTSKADSVTPDKRVVCGLPGVLNKEHTTLLTSPNLPFWINKPIKQSFDKAVSSDVQLQNDSYLSGLGEAVFGAGKNHRIVAYLAFGTGIGGVRVVNGKIDELTWGFEPGHQIIDADGSILGKITDLEDLAGGKGLERRYGKKPEDISEDEVWQEVEKYMAISIVNTALFWSPEIIVIGGGLMSNEKLSLERVSHIVKDNLKIFPTLPEIIKGELGDQAALMGGLAFLKNH